MSGCYYCVDYDAEKNTCALYGDPVDNCDSFLFDTGIDGPAFLLTVYEGKLFHYYVEPEIDCWFTTIDDLLVVFETQQSVDTSEKRSTQ